MPKQRKKLKFRLPKYSPPRNDWRKQIHLAASGARAKAGVRYAESDALSVTVHLYMVDADLAVNDVDNRMKDIFDALQGRVGGPKAKRTLTPLIPNDKQIFRVEMEKSCPPKQSRGYGGHVIIGKLVSRKKRNGA